MVSRRLLVRVAALFVFASFLSQHAGAQPPDILRSYHFIPRHSRVFESGGIAGVFRPYTVRGTFDLITGYEYNFPNLTPYASLENVDAWAHPHSPLTYVLSLDRIFNMSELEGTFQGPHQIHFSGDGDQTGTVELDATLHGRLLHLTGATYPGCCDFFQYEINALAYQTPYGDFNFDGRVDSTDYTVWRDAMGSTTDLAADGNGDGVVDHADYEIWTDQFGTLAIDMSAFDSDDEFAGLSSGGVPEPTTFVLFSVVGVAVLMTRSLRLCRR